ncbi:DUF3823 domain-containing protein [Arsenicibacter rosenii]|uniref:DUF3823 domain-containing protein n=1 Tax=Arsenicibacter rosenii TaxID=1750698 RepID=A0A1S2VD89_9BACT|nr:DUF3823 domain-containing protein [Arsenicibacter rosenii]OIN56659.1 hypothetical protein BLX24_23815 [Arsenicibacter rosenii]
MKFQHLIFPALMALAGLLTGCEKDNYAEPKATISGRVVYQNQPIGVRSNGVQLELWQRGYQLFTKIPVYVDQDGSFSATVFDGNYKLVRLRGNGPWVDNTDTIDVQVRGSATIDVPVQPYFTVANEKFQKAGTAITSTCKINQVLTTRAIERVTLYVGSTQFVDINNNAGNVSKAGADLADLTKELSFTMNIPSSVASKAYVYGRIGVKTVGVAEMLYSPVQKIQLK